MAFIDSTAFNQIGESWTLRSAEGVSLKREAPVCQESGPLIGMKLADKIGRMMPEVREERDEFFPDGVWDDAREMRIIRQQCAFIGDVCAHVRSKPPRAAIFMDNDGTLRLIFQWKEGRYGVIISQDGPPKVYTS